MNRTGFTSNQRMMYLGETDENGLYTDAYSKGKVSKENVQLGHRMYMEHRWMSEAADRMQMKQREFNKMVRAEAKNIFVAQGKKSNLSHRFECKERTIGVNNCIKMISDYLKQNKSVEEKQAIDKRALEARKSFLMDYMNGKQSKSVKIGKNVTQSKSAKIGKNNGKSSHMKSGRESIGMIGQLSHGIKSGHSPSGGKGGHTSGGGKGGLSPSGGHGGHGTGGHSAGKGGHAR